MTREELILYGKGYLHDLETACCKIEEKHKEFVRESIKALEQETVSRETYESEYLARKQAEYELWKIKEQQPSDDCVSRQALISAFPISDTYTLDDIIATIKFQPPVRPTQKWTPVSEELPKEPVYKEFVEPSEPVLVQLDNGEMKVSRYWGSRESYKDEPWIDLSYPTTLEVVAWMPLPEQYKAEMESE